MVMFFESTIKEYGDKNIKLFVDMDGVVADYNVGEASNYDQKRPLTTSIKALEKVSKFDNVEMYILSITRMNEGLEEKDVWLDKYMPFIKKDNRVIISREAHNMMKSADLKARYLKQYNESEDTIILIDDDPRVLSAVMDACPDVILYKDTVLVD